MGRLSTTECTYLPTYLCGFRAGGGGWEQAIHECSRRCVLEAGPKSEECGRKNGAHFFGGGDELCGARALQRFAPCSTGLSASLMVRLILVFLPRHRWILVVAALFTFVSHSLTSLLSVSMEAG